MKLAKSTGLPNLEIRSLAAPDELAPVIALQRCIWPGPDSEIVPVHLLLTAAHNGGLVAGALVDGRLAGFVFGFLGFHAAGQGRRLKHCSHMLGVHPDFRAAGIGAALKRYQREFVLRQGLELITWTYDPLLARNARLNIAKLGAVSNTYFVDLYGALADGLNAGLATDRLQVDWWIRGPWVADHLDAAAAPRPDLASHLAAGALALNPPAADGAPRPPAAPMPGAGGPASVLLDLPHDFQALKSADPGLALRWRLGVRAALLALFAQGYVLNDFLHESGSAPRAAYVLTRALPCLTENTPCR